MKKNIMFLVLVLLFFTKILNASAYQCTYDFKYALGIFGWNDKSSEVTFNVDTQNKTFTYPDGIFDKTVYFMDYYVDNKYTTEYIIESFKGGCPGNIVVTGMIAPTTNAHDIVGYGIFFVQENFFKLTSSVVLGIKYYQYPTSFITGENMLVATTENLISDNTPLIKDKSEAQEVVPKWDCDYVDEPLKKLQGLDCLGNSKCDASQNVEYTQIKDNLKSFCQNVFEFANVGMSSCLEACLEFSEKINDSNVEFSECGFSTSLIIWIVNIMRWVKYIVPVIVILLGILDFIRAVATDKADGMKQAQGRFIKRLIAAALIFIVPLVIEFILKKMGFTAEGCGIIDFL